MSIDGPPHKITITALIRSHLTSRPRPPHLYVQVRSYLIILPHCMIQLCHAMHLVQTAKVHVTMTLFSAASRVHQHIWSGRSLSLSRILLSHTKPPHETTGQFELRSCKTCPCSPAHAMLVSIVFTHGLIHARPSSHQSEKGRVERLATAMGHIKTNKISTKTNLMCF